MAGIGFRLHRAIKHGNWFQRTQGLLGSVVVSSGPWLMAILTIAVISSLAKRFPEPKSGEVFRVILNYSYAFSLILFGVVEMVITRFIADALYFKNIEGIGSFFKRVFWRTTAVGLALGLIFFYLLKIPGLSLILCGIVIAVLMGQWVCMIFLGALKDYLSIVWGFIAGAALSVSAVWMGGKLGISGLNWLLTSFILGNLLIDGILVRKVQLEFQTSPHSPPLSPKVAHSESFLEFWKTRWVLSAVGFFYSLGVWCDKILFWTNSHTREKVAYGLFKSTSYDAGIFLGYLFVVPAMALFLVQIEVKFYMRYREYFGLIHEKAPLAMLEDARQRMVQGLHTEFKWLFLFQILITALAYSASATITQYFKLPAVTLIVFRFGLLGSMFHAFALITNLLILYFDLPFMALKNYLILFLLNLAGTLLSLKFIGGNYGKYFGMGYAFAALVCLTVSLMDLNNVLGRLHSLIFQRQPLASAKKSKHKFFSRNRSLKSSFIWALIALPLFSSPVTARPLDPAAVLPKIEKWIYQLQGDPTGLSNRPARQTTLYVLDISLLEPNKNILKTLSATAPSDPHRSLAYLSVGEAEEYRWYFQGIKQGGLLVSENKRFKKNHLLKFWDPQWRAVLYDYLQKIHDAGFNGVYLDLIDAYGRFPKAEQALRATQMAELVIDLRAKMKSIWGNEPALLAIQNAPCLFLELAAFKEFEVQKKFLESFDLLALESTFYFGSNWQDNPWRPQTEVLSCVKKLQSQSLPRKLILGVEYLTGRRQTAKALEALKKHGFLGLVTGRSLDGSFFKN